MPSRREHPPERTDRRRPGDVEDHVEPRWPARHVLAPVVDDVGCADRAHQLDLVRARGRRHLRAERAGDLHRERADAAAGAGDEDALTGLDSALVADCLERRRAGDGDGRSLLEREVRRLAHEDAADGALGERARAQPEHLVANAQVGLAGPHGVDHPGGIDAQAGHLRSPELAAEPDDERVGPNPAPVERVHRSRPHADPHAAFVRLRRRDLGEFQDLRRAVAPLHDRLHPSPFVHRTISVDGRYSYDVRLSRTDADRTKRAERARARWGSLSRERVLRAAIELADAEGIDALSMRRLGRSSVRSRCRSITGSARRTSCCGGMLDAVYAEMEPALSGDDWRTDIRRAAISSRDVLLRHGWAAGLLMRPAPEPSRAAALDGWVLGRLRDAGFSAGPDAPRLSRARQPRHRVRAVDPAVPRDPGGAA